MQKTREEIVTELQSETCRCGKPKGSGHSLCDPCWNRLPGRIAVRLYHRIGEGYEEAYREATTWLDANHDAPRRDPPPDQASPTVRTYEIPLGSTLSHCRGCGAAIYWIRTPKGANMPVNPKEKTSHFTTCPKAAQFSGKKKATQ